MEPTQAHPQRPRFPSHNSRLIQSRAAERVRRVREIILWGCQYQRAQMELPVSCSPSSVRRETPDPSLRGARRPPGDPRPPPGFWGRDRCGTADPRPARPRPKPRPLCPQPGAGATSRGRVLGLRSPSARLVRAEPGAAACGAPGCWRRCKARGEARL